MTTVSFSIPLIAADARQVVPETRVYNLEIRGGFSPRTLREEINRAARAGFNAILFPVFVNGHTLFPCETSRESRLPHIMPEFRKWNPVLEASLAARAEGMNFWGLVRPYNFHPRYSSSAHRLLERKPAWRIQVHPNLRRHRLPAREAVVACPVNRDYRRHLAGLLVELVSAYPLDGLVVNYTGYSFREGPVKKYPYCFCDACRAAYAERTGGDLVTNALHEEGIRRVRQWQHEISATSIEHLRHRILKARRTLRLVCRAQPQWRWNPEEGDPENQLPYTIDWNSLAEAGAVEEILVDHDDETAPDMFRTRLVTDLAALHDDVLLLPAVRVTQPSDLEKPLEAVRRYPVAGFLAEFALPLTEPDADFIRENHLAQPAHSPDQNPLLAAAHFLKEVGEANADNELLRDFMRDFLRILEGQIKTRTTFPTLEMIYENLAGLVAAIRRGRLGDHPVSEQAMRSLGLARRLVRLACLDVRS